MFWNKINLNDAIIYGIVYSQFEKNQLTGKTVYDELLKTKVYSKIYVLFQFPHKSMLAITNI